MAARAQVSQKINARYAESLATVADKTVRATSALALAAAAKIWPLLLFPIFLGWPPRRWRQILIAIPILAALAFPYLTPTLRWSGIDENLRFMSGFLGGWRNNDSLFGALLWISANRPRSMRSCSRSGSARAASASLAAASTVPRRASSSRRFRSCANTQASKRSALTSFTGQFAQPRRKVLVHR